VKTSFLILILYASGTFAFRLDMPASQLIAQAPQASDQRVNINTATLEELQRLPAIGPVIARRIVEHRSKHGPFRRPQDVIIVRGFSAKRYRQIAHLIKV
jgi:competence ComEA-like helix-hairpin-helix protein